MIAIAVRDTGGHQVVTVAPVTHSASANAEAAVEIPLVTKQRLGLDDARSWVVISEGNECVWPGPDIRPLRLTSGGSIMVFCSQIYFSKFVTR